MEEQRYGSEFDPDVDSDDDSEDLESAQGDLITDTQTIVQGS